LAASTAGHYLPLLYFAALQNGDEAIRLDTNEVVNGSLSMLSASIDGRYPRLMLPQCRACVSNILFR